MKYLEHKGYTGSIEYSAEDNLLFGQVMGIKSLISYEGITGHELELDFRKAIDEYLYDCRTQGFKPEKAFKGSFNVRVSSELHKSAVLQAVKMKTSLNNYVADAIRMQVGRTASSSMAKTKSSKATSSILQTGRKAGKQ